MIFASMKSQAFESKSSPSKELRVISGLVLPSEDSDPGLVKTDFFLSWNSEDVANAPSGTCANFQQTVATLTFTPSFPRRRLA